MSAFKVASLRTETDKPQHMKLILNRKGKAQEWEITSLTRDNMETLWKIRLTGVARFQHIIKAHWAMNERAAGCWTIYSTNLFSNCCCSQICKMIHCVIAQAVQKTVHYWSTGCEVQKESSCLLLKTITYKSLTPENLMWIASSSYRPWKCLLKDASSEW